MNRALAFLENLLFPRRCPLCDKVIGFAAACGCENRVQALMLPVSPLAEPDLPRRWLPQAAYAVYRYQEPVRGAILRLKRDEGGSLARQLAQPLAERCRALGLQEWAQVIAAVPSSKLPLTKKRRGTEVTAPHSGDGTVAEPPGFAGPLPPRGGKGQSLLLARHLAEQTGLPLCANALQKIRPTEPQHMLPRRRRLENLRGAFAAQASAVAGRRVLLIDDVFTTGSTANECCAALLCAGAEGCVVLCLAAAGGE